MTVDRYYCQRYAIKLLGLASTSAPYMYTQYLEVQEV